MFKNTTSDDTTMGGQQTLNLEVSSRKMSEVQMYMSLYYDMRIRSTVVKEWKETKIPNMDFSGLHPEVPENQIDPKDSHLFKDIKIPLCFKRSVAQRLYEAEEEEVQSKHEQRLLIKTIYVIGEEERLELVQEYQKYVTGSVLCILN